MADNNQEWYYANGDQKHGPISSAELKQLATSGKLAPSNLIWKSGWTEWKRADRLKGLFPPGRSVNAPPVPPHGSQPEAFRVATETADQVSQKLWFLDLKFDHFATPKLIGFIFAATLICLVLLAAGIVVYALLNYPALKAAFIVVVDVILLALLAISFRVFLEFCLIKFRIAEHLSYLRYLQKDEFSDS